MNQYMVTFTDDYTEIVLAYGYRVEGQRYIFDEGKGRDFILWHVKSVEVVG